MSCQHATTVWVNRSFRSLRRSLSAVPEATTSDAPAAAVDGNRTVDNTGVSSANDVCPPPKRIHFSIIGEPQPLRRHRVAANYRMYNPSFADQKRFIEESTPYLPSVPMDGPIEANLVFRMKRPRSHYRSGRYSHILKKDAPRYHTCRTDIDNLVKLVLDSLNDRAYYDDRQVVCIKAIKEYCNLGTGSTEVTLSLLEEAVGEVREVVEGIEREEEVVEEEVDEQQELVESSSKASR